MSSIWKQLLHILRGIHLRQHICWSNWRKIMTQKSLKKKKKSTEASLVWTLLHLYLEELSHNPSEFPSSSTSASSSSSSFVMFRCCLTLRATCFHAFSFSVNELRSAVMIITPAALTCVQMCHLLLSCDMWRVLSISIKFHGAFAKYFVMYLLFFLTWTRLILVLFKSSRWQEIGIILIRSPYQLVQPRLHWVLRRLIIQLSDCFSSCWKKNKSEKKDCLSFLTRWWSVLQLHGGCGCLFLHSWLHSTSFK